MLVTSSVGIGIELQLSAIILRHGLRTVARRCARVYILSFPALNTICGFSSTSFNNSAHYLPTANRRLPSMTKTASMKTSKALETPKAKAQGEVDYKAKIDVVIEAFSAKVT